MEQGGNLIEPAARVHAAAAGERDDGVRIGCGSRFDERVLAPRQREGAVEALALCGWVEADGDDDDVCADANCLHVLARSFRLVHNAEAETIAAEAREIIGDDL